MTITRLMISHDSGYNRSHIIMAEQSDAALLLRHLLRHPSHLLLIPPSSSSCIERLLWMQIKSGTTPYFLSATHPKLLL